MNNDLSSREQLLDITQSFLVQAPAGSGKTSVLVQRYLCALANAIDGPEEIIAITFTKKAAAEMRERILDALQKAHNGIHAKNPYEQKLLDLANCVLKRDKEAAWDLLDNPARLKIQTIDALCASITKQMPILSRFGAQPQIATDAEILYAKAAQQLLQTLDQGDAYPHNSSLFKLLDHLDNDRLKVSRLLQQILSKREHWLPILMQHKDTHNLRIFLEKGLLLACEEAVMDLDNLRPAVLDCAVMSLTEPQTLHEWLVVVEKLLTSEGTWRKTVTQAQGFHAPSKARNKEEKLQLQAAKDAMLLMLDRLRVHDDFRHALSLLRQLPPMEYSDQQWEIVDALIQILPVLAAQLSVVFRDLGQVDFIAVALAAIAALQNTESPTDLSLALDCKIKHILVDEFQDTSHLQFTLLEQLTHSWEPFDGRTLFLVGDPMQSIYSFRQAEVGLFIKAREQGIGNISLQFVQLSSNFRSTPGVIKWINEVFTHSFPKADNKTLGAIRYTQALAQKEANDDNLSVVCRAVSDALTAQEVVNIIQSTRLTTPNASIAILVRAKNHLDKILPALRLANIKFQGIDIENLYHRPIIQDLLSLTKAILHLDDRIAWLAILRAPWCGLKITDMQVIASFDGTIFAALFEPTILEMLSLDGLTRIKHIRIVMQDILGLLGRSNIQELVKMAAQNLNVHACLQSIDEQNEVTAYFNFLEKNAMRSEIYTPGFLDKELSKLFLQPCEEAVIDAVQIMTIHKSKGLEFDVVILPHLDKSTRNQDQELLLLEMRDYMHQYLLLAPIKAAHNDSDLVYNYLAWCRRQRGEYETLRELYVAITRAKHKVFCLANVGMEENAAGMLKHVWPHIHQQFAVSDNAEVLEIPPNTHVRRLPIDSFSQEIYTPLHIRKMPIATKAWQANWMNQAGTVMHRILSHIATVGLENIHKQYFAQLDEICAKYLKAISMLQEHQLPAQQLIVRAINNMLSDPQGKVFLSNSHKQSFTEWALTTPDAEKFVQVRLDRVFLDQDDKLWLVDYKLVANADVSASINQYRGQVQAYALMLKALMPDHRLVSGLYFPLQKHWENIL